MWPSGPADVLRVGAHEETLTSDPSSVFAVPPPSAEAGTQPAAGSATGATADTTADTTADPTIGRVPTRQRFWVHALLLLVALLALTAYLDNGHPANSDEGAVEAQVSHLAEGTWNDPASWRIDRSFTEIDPAGRYTPLENSEIGVDTYLPYAKHPLYPLLLLPAWNLLGVPGLIAVSAVAAWIAALMGAAIVRRVRPDLQLATLWILGFGTPLLFDSMVVMGHALGAALLGTVVVCVLQHLERPRPDLRGVAAVAGAAVATAALVMLRSEGMLAIAALVAVLATMSVRSIRPPRLDFRRLVPAGVIWIVAVGAYLTDRALAARLIGVGARGIGSPTAGTGFIDGRLSALWITVLQPSAGYPHWGDTVLFICCVCILGAGILLRLHPERTRWVVGLLGVAAVLAVVRQLGPSALVSGMLPAVPVMFAGLILLRRQDLRSIAARLCIGTAALAALAIWLTSYAIGGGVEWGGRFFHLLLPLVAPFAVIGLDRARRLLPVGGPGPDLRRLATTAAVVVIASLSFFLVRAADDNRIASKIIVDSALAAVDDARPAADGGRPILITDPQPFGRSAWASLDEYRILRVPTGSQLTPLLEGLAGANVGTVTVFVSSLLAIPDAVLDDWTVVAERPLPGWHITYVELQQR